MLVKVTNGNVDTYPYSVGQLRRDNPNTSFPKTVPTATLEAYGVYAVTVEAEPSYTERTQKIERNSAPTNSGSGWTVGWTVTDKTSAEITEYDANVATQNRSRRDDMLSDSDWTQMNDSPLSNEAKTSWATYRQALRDITSHANWPNLTDADWPTEPS